jgi:hypothetical protein
MWFGSRSSSSLSLFDGWSTSSDNQPKKIPASQRHSPRKDASSPAMEDYENDYDPYPDFLITGRSQNPARSNSISQDLRKWDQIWDRAGGTTDGNQGIISRCGWNPPSTVQTCQENQRSRASRPRHQTYDDPILSRGVDSSFYSPPKPTVFHLPPQSIRPLGFLRSPCAFPGRAFPATARSPFQGHTLKFSDPFFSWDTMMIKIPFLCFINGSIEQLRMLSSTSAVNEDTSRIRNRLVSKNDDCIVVEFRFSLSLSSLQDHQAI